MITNARRFILIGIVTIIGLVAAWPPREKLKLGIDLSGGTILVYEVKKDSRPDYDIDELIAALKRRVNPEGVQDIPIRKVGNNRIEIILPQATPAEVEDVKRKMTDVGSLELRILASEKKDTSEIDRALSANGLKNPPRGFRWAKLGEIVTGEKPKITADTLTDASQSWIRDRYASPTRVLLTGKDDAGRDKSIYVTILSNTPTTLKLDTEKAVSTKEEDSDASPRFIKIGPLTTYFKTIDSYKIDYNPGQIQPGPSAIVREQLRGKGFLERFILIKEDRQNVTGFNNYQ